MSASALVKAHKIQIASTLTGIVSEDELNDKVNELLEKELCARAATAIMEYSAGYMGTYAQRLGKAMAAMTTLQFHLEQQMNLQRAMITQGVHQ